jgi:hypothetical protein
MAKLYELSTAYNAILQQLEDADETQLQCLTDTLDSIQSSIEVKVDGISKMLKIISDTTAIDAEIARLQKMKRSAQSKERWLKNYLQSQMELMGIEKLKTDLFSVSIQNNPPSVDDYDPSMIPATYQKVSYDIDRRRILDDLKAGKEVPGCALKQSKSIRIR